MTLSECLCNAVLTYQRSVQQCNLRALRLDPDQARQNVGSDLDPNCLTLMVFLKEFCENVNFEKNHQMTKIVFLMMWLIWRDHSPSLYSKTCVKAA